MNNIVRTNNINDRSDAMDREKLSDFCAVSRAANPGFSLITINFLVHTLKFSNMKKISLSIIAVAALLVAVTFTGCTREESK